MPSSAIDGGRAGGEGMRPVLGRCEQFFEAIIAGLGIALCVLATAWGWWSASPTLPVNLVLGRMPGQRLHGHGYGARTDRGCHPSRARAPRGPHLPCRDRARRAAPAQSQPPDAATLTPVLGAATLAISVTIAIWATPTGSHGPAGRALRQLMDLTPPRRDAGHGERARGPPAQRRRHGALVPAGPAKACRHPRLCAGVPAGSEACYLPRSEPDEQYV